MDFTLSIINGATCVIIAATLLGAILSPNIHDGIIIKVGLISMTFGFASIGLRMMDGTAIGDGPVLVRSIILVNAGIAVVIVGYLYRSKKAQHPLKRFSDWVHRRQKTETQA